MNAVAVVLITVAKELSELAKNSLPALRKGETIEREWFKDAVYYRETSFKGQRFVASFNFRNRTNTVK